jgi:hypothetical protein
LNLLVAGANLLFLPENFVVGNFNGDGIPDEASSNLNAGGGIEVWGMGMEPSRVASSRL